jgi:hypothetical protein
MIEIVYNWRMKNDIITRRVIGLGYHKGNTNFGQCDFLTVIDEEFDIISQQCVWGTLLFSSGSWIRIFKNYIKNGGLKK